MRHSKRKKYVKTPSGKIKLHIKKKKPGFHRCGNCGKVLRAIPRLRLAKFKNLPSSRKTPSRMFGNLCSSCARLKIIEKVRNR